MTPDIFMKISLIIAAITFSIFTSCTYVGFDMPETRSPERGDGIPRHEAEGYGQVLLYYAAGYNNLSSYIKEDIGDMLGGYIPEKWPHGDIFLIFSHLTEKQGDYDTPTSPVLEQIYRLGNGDIVRDTLLVMEKDRLASSSRTMNEVLTFIKDRYPSEEYGMIFSSHATGWIPDGSDATVSAAGVLSCDSSGRPVFQDPAPSPYIERPFTPGEPAVKSIGSEYKAGDRRSEYKMYITDYASAIPMKLDYMIFDACLMGGIEIAYELKDKCGAVAFSQTEVLAGGFDYTTLLSRLLKPGKADLEQVCRDYFSFYDSQSGDYRSATISMVDCSKLDPLAEVCRNVFSAHREGFKDIRPADIQCFGRYPGHKYFYDLKDIIEHLGISANELEDLEAALDECIVYKAATEKFISITIDRFCGLSSYLPNGNYDAFYKKLKWNADTGMVL